jgi:hypothetical protein
MGTPTLRTGYQAMNPQTSNMDVGRRSSENEAAGQRADLLNDETENVAHVLVRPPHGAVMAS